MARYIYNSDITKIINDTDAFSDFSGTQFPSSWDKSTIPGMQVIAETNAPDSSLNAISGSAVEMVNDIPTIVWNYVPYTSEQLSQMAKDTTNAGIKAQIATLEDSVTPRRNREALLTDAGKAWLSSVDSQIATLRLRLVS